MQYDKCTNMLRDFSDNELTAQILSYLWDQGSWGEIYRSERESPDPLDIGSSLLDK